MYLWDKDKSSWPAERFGKLLKWEKLSNSGETLKLLIPNYILKIISGWTNYSCKVISQKIDENKMGNCGSKSDYKLKSVKEQRVDGSWHNLIMCLRYILMGFERNYRVRIPSNQINKASYSTLMPQSKMNPWFLTGFADAEGSFSILIQHNVKHQTNWRVKAIFAIGLHKKDTVILEEIKSTLGVGNIHKHGKDSVQYRVESIKELQVIVDHFDKYKLITQKVSDYLLFKQSFELIKNKEHLSIEGLKKIVAIKASLNLGLTHDLKEAFSDVVQFKKPEYTFKGIADPFWIAGFTSGDGSFNIKISSSTTNKLGSRVQLRFSIGLHIREKELIKGLVTFLNLGYSSELKSEVKDKYIYITNDSVNLQIMKFSDIISIINFFDKYPIQGTKILDFADFKKVSEILKNKEHLTPEGFNKILEIKAGMNKERL